MRVLHVVKTAVGAAWALQQVRVLCALGIEVIVALPSTTDGLAPLYKKAGAAVIPVNVDFRSHHLWRVPSVLSACRRLLHEVQPDIVHSHHVGTAFIMRAARGRHSPIPHIFQVPGPLHLEYSVPAALDLRLAGARDYWIATCQWTHRRYLELGVDPGRVFLTYAGTDVKPFGSPRNGHLRSELKIPVSAPLIGMVAYMYAPSWFLRQRQGLKGHEDFMRAFALARRDCPELRGVIIGGPWAGAVWYEKYLRELGASTCGESLTFVGHRNDVPVIYPDLDLAVVASHSENCGGALEPLLSGVPVVATNVGGLPDLIKNGETGWLVPPRNPEALAHAILDALHHPQEANRRAHEGQKRARHLFDIEKVGRQVASIYERIVSYPSQSAPGEEVASRVAAVA